MAHPNWDVERAMLLKASVRGEVQGVGFRYFVVRKAGGLNVRGYVQNKADGSVYVVAAGGRRALEELLAALEKGPSQARVTTVDAQWSEEGEHVFPSGFEVRY